jgi:hypothetical protein
MVTKTSILQIGTQQAIDVDIKGIGEEKGPLFSSGTGPPEQLDPVLRFITMVHS